MDSFTTDEKALEKINRFARKPLTAEQVYCFSVILCDNEIDRDNEKFSIKTLNALSELFIGKTGIFDHDPKGENQRARIYNTEIKTFPEKTTRDGEMYTALMGSAYMLRTDSNKELIMEIDGGIKKEVSVSCSVKNSICSICHSDKNTQPCSHVSGKYYGEKLCYFTLENPTDAYEWSFVAIPAQINAGVTKRFSQNAVQPEFTKQLNEKNEKLSAACEYLRGEILKLSYFAKPFHSSEWIRKMTEGMDVYELLSLKKSFEKELKTNEKTLSAEEKSFITAIYPEDENDNSDFKM